MTLVDFFKFLPGWLAFVFTVGAGVQQWRVRRHKLALGPDDDAAREQLTKARALFVDITAQDGQRAKWFDNEERRQIGQLISDLAVRRKDQKLKDAMLSVANSWQTALAVAPPERVRVRWLDKLDQNVPLSQLEQEQAAEDLIRTNLQLEAARAGIKHIKTAIDRLNELETRTHGRG